MIASHVGLFELAIAGFGRFQWLMLLYTGLAWCADAMEMMLLSFLGPAVSFLRNKKRKVYAGRRLGRLHIDRGVPFAHECKPSL